MSVRKAVIYCRVSSRSQETEGHGLVTQEARCRHYAEAKGYEVVAVFPDTITGGGDFMKRPGMVALLSFIDAQPGKEFVVIFDDLKRFARDTRFHLDLRDAFRRRNATIECLNFTFDDSPEGEFVETVLAAQGALERKQNGRQVAQKMLVRTQFGYWCHLAPVGFRFETVKGHGRMMVRDEPVASIVQEALEGYAMGRFQTLAEVQVFLQDQPQFPRGPSGKVGPERVSNLMRQPLYAGYIDSEKYGISWLKAQHEPLITLETYQKIQDRRAGVAKAPKRANIGNAFALRGIVACASCDAPMRSSFSKGRHGKRYPYYLCHTKGCEAYGKSIKRDVLEADVGEIIKALEPAPQLMSLAAAMFRYAWTARESQAGEVVNAVRRQMAALDRQIEKTLDRIMDATNATVIRNYEQKIDQFEREKLVLADKAANSAQSRGSFEENIEPALTFLANPWKLWELGHVTLRRTVLKLAFADRIRYCRNTGPRNPKIALPFKAIGEFCIVNEVSGGRPWNTSGLC